MARESTLSDYPLLSLVTAARGKADHSRTRGKTPKYRRQCVSVIDFLPLSLAAN